MMSCHILCAGDGSEGHASTVFNRPVIWFAPAESDALYWPQKIYLFIGQRQCLPIHRYGSPVFG